MQDGNRRRFWRRRAEDPYENFYADFYKSEDRAGRRVRGSSSASRPLAAALAFVSRVPRPRLRLAPVAAVLSSIAPRPRLLLASVATALAAVGLLLGALSVMASGTDHSPPPGSASSSGGPVDMAGIARDLPSTVPFTASAGAGVAGGTSPSLGGAGGGLPGFGPASVVRQGETGPPPASSTVAGPSSTTSATPTPMPTPTPTPSPSSQTSTPPPPPPTTPPQTCLLSNPLPTGGCLLPSPSLP